MSSICISDADNFASIRTGPTRDCKEVSAVSVSCKITQHLRNESQRKFSTDLTNFYHNLTNFNVLSDSCNHLITKCVTFFFFFKNFLQLYSPSGISPMGDLGKPAATVTLPKLCIAHAWCCSFP